MESSASTEKKLYQRPSLLFSFALLVLFFALSLSGVAVGTGDDNVLELLLLGGTFKGAWAFAELQGRYTYLLHIPLGVIPFIFEKGGLVFSLLKFGVLLSFLASLAWALDNFKYSRNFIFLFVVSCLLFWLDGWEHSLLSAYPFFFFFSFSVSVVAFVFFDKYLKQQGTKFLIIAVFLWLYIVTEYIFQFAYLPLLLIFLQRKTSPVVYKAGLVFVGICFIYLSLYLGFRLVFGSDYKGNQFQFSPLDSIRTFFQLTIAGMPGYAFISPEKYTFNAFPKLEWLLVIKIFLVCLIAFQIKQTDVDVKKENNYWIFPLFCLISIFAPNVLLSLTVKYQQWVKDGVESYLSSHISYIAWNLLFVWIVFYLLAYCKSIVQFRLVKSIVAVLAIFIILSVESHNQGIRIEQKQNFARWELLDVWVKSESYKDIDAGTHVFAEPFINYRSDLWIASSGGYWTSYFFQKYGKKLYIFSEYWQLKVAGLANIERLLHLGFAPILNSVEMYFVIADLEPVFKNKNLVSNRLVIITKKENLKLLITGHLDGDADYVVVDGREFPVVDGVFTAEILTDNVEFEINSKQKIKLSSLVISLN